MRLGMSRNAYSINIYFETKVSVPSGNILCTIKIETPSAILDDVHIQIPSEIYIRAFINKDSSPNIYFLVITNSMELYEYFMWR